jgi:hypothetical protein
VNYKVTPLKYLRTGVCASVNKFQNIENEIDIQLRKQRYIRDTKQHREEGNNLYNLIILYVSILLHCIVQ